MTDQPGPVDLENIRSIGIRSLEILCGCGHRVEVNVDQFPGHYTVPAMTRFFRCQACGKRPKTSRPNGADMRRYPMGSGNLITEQRGPNRI